MGPVPLSRPLVTPESDDELIRLAQGGDLAAFEKLMAAHVRGVRVFVALKAPVSELIDELTHETFVFAFRRLGDFTTGSFQGWLRAIAFNLLRKRVLEYSRQQQNLGRYLDHARIQAAHSGANDSGTRAADFLAECIERVPPNMREVLDLKYRDGCSSEEIARRVGQTDSWVRQLLLRLRRKLRDCIETKLTSEGRA